MSTQELDYLIIGAGSTGVHLASSLVERGRSVLIIDSVAKSHSPFYLKPPLLAPFLLDNKNFTEVLQTEGQIGLNERRTTLFRSRLIGGLAEMNGGVCFAGHKDLYLNAFGSTTADYQTVVDKLMQIDNIFSANLYASRRYAWNSPISDKFKNYWGRPNSQNIDFDHVLLGAGPLRINRKIYGRHTGLQRFRNHVNSGLIQYINKNRVHSLKIEAGLVAGILFEGSDEVFNVRAKKVVLCAGVIGSPMILLRSGIGNPEELDKAGIAAKVDLCGVGRNLSDHPNFRIPFSSKSYDKWSISNKNAALIEIMKFALGFESYIGSSGASSAANFLPNSSNSINDIIRAQLVHFSLKKSNDRSAFLIDSRYNFSLSISLLAPLSRGCVALSEGGQLKINPGYLTNARDIENLKSGFRKGLEFIKEIGGRSSEQIMSINKSDVEQFVRDSVNTGYHMVGTCSMGDDPMRYVCNTDLSVKKMENLYVCDASVFPSQVSSNTYMPCLMLADYFISKCA